MNTPTRARLQELLGTEATQPLSAAEEAELDALLAAFPDQNPDDFELAAAAVHLALVGAPEALPTAVAEKLHLTAVAMTPAARSAEPGKPRERSGRPAWSAWAGWTVAAGLAGLLVYTNWPKPHEKPTEVANVTPEQKRDALAKNHQAKPARFAETKGNASASVVWSDVRQEGYLEVRGLPPNDPQKERYQLWVVDAKRPKDFPPISAGLFDVRPGTNMVAVSASIPVGDAAMFVISKEGPNGVWVTTPDKFVMVMPAKAG